MTSDAHTGARPEFDAEELMLPAVIERNRNRVKRSFWSKLRRVAGRIPFAEDAVAMYYCALDPATPLRVRATLFGALAYFVVPTDVIPDFIAGLGFTDDASVIAAALALVAGHVRDSHRERARNALADTTAAGSPDTGTS